MTSYVYDTTSAQLTSVIGVEGTTTMTYNTRGLPDTVTTHEGTPRSFT